MWKKVLVSLLAMVGAFSVAYSYYNFEMNASTYNIGGSVYGQIGAPSRGDRIYLGTKNSNGGNMGWVLLEEYIAGKGNANFKGETNSWYAMSTSPLDTATFYDDNSLITTYDLSFNPNNTAQANRYNDYNTRMNKNTQDMKLVTTYNTEWINSMWNNEFLHDLYVSSDYGIQHIIKLNKPVATWLDSDFIGGAASKYKSYVTRIYYVWLLPDLYGTTYANNTFSGHKGVYASSLGALWLNDNELTRACTSAQCANSIDVYKNIANPPGRGTNQKFNVNGVNLPFQSSFAIFYETKESAQYKVTSSGNSDAFGDWTSDKIQMNSTTKYAIRPSIEFDRDMISKIVFSLSQPTQSGTGNVTISEPVKTIGTYKTGEDMKVRILNDSFKAIFEDILYNNESVYDRQKIDKSGIALVPDTETIQLKVQANKGTSPYGVNTVSALIFDSTDQFIAYAPLATTKDGSNIYDLDISKLNLTVGNTYSIKVVNEVYNTDVTEVSPADCSAISDALRVKIVKPLTLEYTPTYDPDNAGSEPYEYNKNVNAQDRIGNVTSKNGETNTTISIIADPNHVDEGHDNDYLNFMLDSSAIPAISTNVKVKAGGPDVTNLGLKAGTYYFRIQGYDQYGNVETSAYVDVVITVNKSTPTVIFNTSTKTNVKIGSSTITEQITYTNSDLAIGGAVPSYVTSGGSAGTGLSVIGSSTSLTDFDIAVGSSSTASLPTTFTLTVTTPETDNYLSATATKQIMVYDDLSALTWTPSKTNYSPSDVTSGKVIGTLEAVGGYGPYTYSLVPTTDPNYSSTDGADNNSFTISKTPIASGTQDVSTNTTLVAGQKYHIQMMVTDSLGNTKYQNAVITVIANAQAALQYKDKAGGTVITSFSFTYPDNTKKLIAEGGSGTGAITYDFAPASAQPAGITPSDYLTVGKSSGLLTPKKPGTVVIRATKAGDSTYSSTYVDIPVTILPAKQSLAWSGSKVTPVSGSSDTWEMDTYWSGGSTDTYGIQELLNGTVLTDDIGISTDVPNASSATSFTYSIIASPADQALVSLTSNTLTITGKPSGVVQIKAERAGELGYDKSDPIYLNLKIKALPDIKFTFDVANGCSANMAAASACTLNTKKLGDLSLNPTTSGFTYSIKTAEYDSTGTGNSYSTAPGIFNLTNKTEIKLLNNLSNGIYRITFTSTDGTYTLSDLVVTITISNNAFNTANWTWVAGDVSSMSAVSGTMNVSTNENTDAYQRVYAPATNGIKDQFQVELKGIPSGASVAYDVRSNNVSNVISHGANDIFQVDGAGGGSSSGSHTVFVEATVSMSGYSDVTVYLPIEITKYTQTIAFANNTAIFLPNNGVCTTIPSASVTSTHSNFVSPGNPISYAPDTNSASAITVNGNQICSVSGTTNTSAKIIATLDGDTNYSDATATKNVVLYAPGSITVTQSIQAITGGASNITYTPGTHIVAHDSASVQNGTASQNAKVANVKLTGMAGASSYALSTNTGSANDDRGFFTVNKTSGDINLSQDITASDIFGHGNIFYIQVDVTDPHGFVQTVDVEIIIDDAIAEFYFHDSGNPLPTTGTGSGIYVDGVTGVAKYTEPFAQNGTITRIETNRGDATYSVDNDPQTASDVIHLVSGYTYGIDNATDEQGTYGGSGGKAYAKACIPAGSGYQAQCIYAEIEITKAPQTGFAFAQDPLNLTTSTSSIVPLYTNHFDGQDVLISNSSDPSIVDGGTYTQGSDQELVVYKAGGPVVITATTAGNRNYQSATDTTNVNVTTKPATTLTVDVNPKPIYYGDTNKVAKINSGYQSTLPAYFTSSDSSIVEVSDTNVLDDESGNLIIKKIGTVDIEVCQTDQANYQAGDPCPSGADYGYKTITVLPRPITLKLSDKTIYTGQALPDYSFEATPVNGTYAGSDTITDFALPNNTNAMDGTSIVSNSSTAGTYAIQGSYSSAENSTAFLSNYNVTIQDGTLTIKQDPSDTSWYYLEGATSGNQPLNPNTWYKEDVYVKLDPANATESAGSYDEISETVLFTNSDKSKFLVTKEDANTTDMYFRIDPNGGSANAGTISSKQSTTIKIDKTAPKIKGAKGTPSTNNAIETLINIISFNTFFKPGVDVIISTEDPQPQGAISTVSVSGVQKVDYTIYEVDEKTGVVDATKAPTTGSGSVDANGDISFKIPNIGAYKVCAIATDQAGNPSGEECYYINVKKINIKVDDDDQPDFNDPDGDGCPDLNIKWKDPNDDSKWIIINGDRDYDGIPDLNIDSDGDGIVDLNVDTDGDGKPDLNLVALTKDDWVPTKCVLKNESKGIMEEYCTGTDVKPKINVDTTGNGIPNINIDTDGDMIADINIDQNQNGILDEYDFNITSEIKTWKPKNDYTYQNFLYDTESEHKAYVNVIVKGTSLPSLNIDTDGDGLPDLNIDADGNGIPEINVDITGDGIADINLDPDQTGTPVEKLYTLTEWKPNTNITGENFDYMTMVIEVFTELKDQGISVTPSNPDQIFLPNYALKVVDITNDQKEMVEKEADTLISDEEEVKVIYDVKLLQDDIEVQPDGTLKVRIPLPEGVKNPRALMKKADGTYEEVSVTIKDGYIEYETDELGIVSILGTKIEDEPSIEPDHPDSSVSNQPNHDSDVKTTYTSDLPNTISGVGGAVTGDVSHMLVYLGMFSISFGVLFLILYKHLGNKHE